MESSKQESKRWKEITLGGISGILLGSTGTLFASNIPLKEENVNENNSENNNSQNNNNNAQNNNSQNNNNSSQNNNTSGNNNISENNNTPVIYSTAPIADHVNDSMSFGQAFSAARTEVGAGGVFEWHGNIYGTYTAEEWAQMNADDRNQYSESIHWNRPTRSTNSHHEINNNGEPQNQDEPDVEIIALEHGDDDSIIGTASVGGQTVYFVDIDGHDDQFDVMIADSNHNGSVEDSEIIDISARHVSVSQFANLASNNNSINSPTNSHEEQLAYYADNENLPDYVNDADPGNLA